MKYKEKIVKIPLCEICETELPQQHPHCKFGDDYYCGDCALKLGKITKEEYIKTFLYYISPDLIKDVIIEDNKIKVI